jgi:hypothetical protein
MNLDSAVEAEATRPFDKLRAPSEVEGLTLAATRSGDHSLTLAATGSGSLNGGIYHE